MDVRSARNQPAGWQLSSQTRTKENPQERVFFVDDSVFIRPNICGYFLEMLVPIELRDDTDYAHFDAFAGFDIESGQFAVP